MANVRPHNPRFWSPFLYLWLKLIHVVAVVAFLGNISSGLFWHSHAAQTRDPKLLAHVMDGIVRSDRMFTVPGVVVIIVAGVLLAVEGGLSLPGTPWISWSLLLFALSGAAFIWRIAPLQRRLLAMVREENFNYERYAVLALRWERWGAFALLTPAAALALMVLKPGA